MVYNAFCMISSVSTFGVSAWYIMPAFGISPFTPLRTFIMTHTVDVDSADKPAVCVHIPRYITDIYMHKHVSYVCDVHLAPEYLGSKSR